VAREREILRDERAGELALAIGRLPPEIAPDVAHLCLAVGLPPAGEEIVCQRWGAPEEGETLSPAPGWHSLAEGIAGAERWDLGDAPRRALCLALVRLHPSLARLPPAARPAWHTIAAVAQHGAPPCAVCRASGDPDCRGCRGDGWVWPRAEEAP
jgi:hypothetical protein